METQFKTSFIPQKSINTSVNQRSPGVSQKNASGTILSLIGTFVFLVALGAYAATFAWQFKLNNDIKNQVASLEKAKEEFDESFLQNASRLNTRLVQANQILENHVAPSSLYQLLETYTLQTVSFKQFSFLDNEDGSIDVKGSGDAARYESIVNQSKSFGDSNLLRNVIFTDLKPAEQGPNVGFTFEATLDPRVIFYRNSLPEVSNQQN